MFDEPIRREVSGTLPNGERVFLGVIRLTDSAVRDSLDDLGAAYATGDGASVRTATGVYNAHAFTGIQYAPGPKT